MYTDTYLSACVHMSIHICIVTEGERKRERETDR